MPTKTFFSYIAQYSASSLIHQVIINSNLTRQFSNYRLYLAHTFVTSATHPTISIIQSATPHSLHGNVVASTQLKLILINWIKTVPSFAVCILQRLLLFKWPLSALSHRKTSTVWFVFQPARRRIVSIFFLELRSLKNSPFNIQVASAYYFTSSLNV